MEHDIELRRFMVSCKDADIEIERKGDKLLVRGGEDRPDLYDGIKQRKQEIIDAMSNVPDAVEEYYKPRLIKGMKYLHECAVRLVHDPDDRPQQNRIVRLLHLWADIDEELRRIYPEYRGCPIGGCDRFFDDDTVIIPVRCMHCATSPTLTA